MIQTNVRMTDTLSHLCCQQASQLLSEQDVQPETQGAHLSLFVLAIHSHSSQSRDVQQHAAG